MKINVHSDHVWKWISWTHAHWSRRENMHHDNTAYTHYSGAYFVLAKTVKINPAFTSSKLKYFCISIFDLTQLHTPPLESAQPQKWFTANISSGTPKTLINRSLRLKDQIFWQHPVEKKPFFSRLKNDIQKYVLKSYWPPYFLTFFIKPNRCRVDDIL